MIIKIIFISTTSHIAPLCSKGFGQLENGLLNDMCFVFFRMTPRLARLSTVQSKPGLLLTLICWKSWSWKKN